MANKLLNILPKVQKKGLLCWAACIEMVIENYTDSTITQKEICLQRNQLEYNTATLEDARTLISQNSIDIESNYCLGEVDNNIFKSLKNDSHYIPILEEKSIVPFTFKKGGFLSNISLKKLIKTYNQSVLLSNIILPQLGRHAVLIIGYSEENDKPFQIAINDPYIYFNYPTTLFDPCNESSIAGRGCCIYRNLVYYNFIKQSQYTNLFDNILNISNFQIDSNSHLTFKTQISNYVSKSSIQDALALFDPIFLNNIFGFIPDLTVRVAVRCFSIMKSSSDSYRDYNEEEMIMPIFIAGSNDFDEHFLEFVYYVPITETPKFIPICIRQPYFNKFLAIARAVLPDGTKFFFDHQNINYFLVNIPQFGYNFMGFESNGETFLMPLETYDETHGLIEVNAIKEDDFNLIVKLLKFNKDE